MNPAQTFERNILPSSHLFNLNIRASRSEYWWAYLIVMVAFVVLFGVSSIIAVMGDNILVLLTSVLTNTLLQLYLSLVMFRLAVLRLHDLNKSGWNLLWMFIPIVGVLYVLYLQVRPGTRGANRFGEDPLAEELPQSNVSTVGCIHGGNPL